MPRSVVSKIKQCRDKEDDRNQLVWREFTLLISSALWSRSISERSANLIDERALETNDCLNFYLSFICRKGFCIIDSCGIRCHWTVQEFNIVDWNYVGEVKSVRNDNLMEQWAPCPVMEVFMIFTYYYISTYVSFIFRSCIIWIVIMK